MSILCLSKMGKKYLSVRSYGNQNSHLVFCKPFQRKSQLLTYKKPIMFRNGKILKRRGLDVFNFT